MKKFKILFNSAKIVRSTKIITFDFERNFVVKIKILLKFCLKFITSVPREIQKL